MIDDGGRRPPTNCRASRVARATVRRSTERPAELRRRRRRAVCDRFSLFFRALSWFWVGFDGFSWTFFRGISGAGSTPIYPHPPARNPSGKRLINPSTHQPTHDVKQQFIQQYSSTYVTSSTHRCTGTCCTGCAAILLQYVPAVVLLYCCIQRAT